MGTVYKFNAWLPEKKHMIHDAVVLSPDSLVPVSLFAPEGPVIWLPYTGVNDINAEDIFLYDILKYKGGNYVVVSGDGQYYLFPYGSGVSRFGTTTLDSSMKKIGNYFENRDLIPGIELSV